MGDTGAMREVAVRMRAAATAFVESLTAEQRDLATAPFDAPDRERWTYLPGDRPGIVMGALDDAQRALALDLLATSYSRRGLEDAHAVIEVEAIRRQLAGAAANSVDPTTDLRYWVRVLDDPGGDGPWTWRINGHHLLADGVVVGDQVAGTPQFFGAEPARVPEGQREGFRALAREEDLARHLVNSLDDNQRTVAVRSAVAPGDILTRFDPVADLAKVTSGLPHARMGAEQQGLLVELIRQYVERVAPPLADRAWSDITEAGLDIVTFTWAGGTNVGEGHYYAVKAETFLLEYDNTQDGANHIHTVWRDVRNDGGRDLLAEHYASAHERPARS